MNRFHHQTIDNPEYMPWPIINNANNQAEQITSPQPVEYSTTVNTCRSAPKSPYKTNINDSKLHIRNLFSSQSSSQKTTSYSHTFSPIISSTPHTVKQKLILTQFILMTDRREHGLNLNAIVIQFHQILFQKFKRNNSFIQICY